jgi:hypothetical protein
MPVMHPQLAIIMFLGIFYQHFLHHYFKLRSRIHLIPQHRRDFCLQPTHMHPFIRNRIGPISLYGQFQQYTMVHFAPVRV